MRLWTIQPIEFYDTLRKNGVVYCDRESWYCREFRVMYDWMALEMSKRIGNPPRSEIRYPLWAWYQYFCRKRPKPPVSPDMFEDEEKLGVVLEIEIPDNEVLLSNFDLWHIPMMGQPISDDKHLQKRLDEFRAKHGIKCTFHDYPEDLQKDIMATWNQIFDLRTKLKRWESRAMWNRPIQACFWELRLEQVMKVEFVEKNN